MPQGDLPTILIACGTTGMGLPSAQRAATVRIQGPCQTGVPGPGLCGGGTPKNRLCPPHHTKNQNQTTRPGHMDAWMTSLANFLRPLLRPPLARHGV